MALLKDYYNPQFNVTISNAYWKVEVNNGIVGKTNLRVRMSCYKDRNTADTNIGKYCDFDFEFTPNLNSGVNFIAQAYIYAKTLPEFSGAIDA
jgi:hypothetical protein